MELTVPIRVEIDEEKLQFLYNNGYQQGVDDLYEIVKRLDVSPVDMIWLDREVKKMRGEKNENM